MYLVRLLLLSNKLCGRPRPSEEVKGWGWLYIGKNRRGVKEINYGVPCETDPHGFLFVLLAISTVPDRLQFYHCCLPTSYLLVDLIIFGLRSTEDFCVSSSCLFAGANVRHNNGVISLPSCKWTKLSTCEVQ